VSIAPKAPCGKWLRVGARWRQSNEQPYCALLADQRIVKPRKSPQRGLHPGNQICRRLLPDQTVQRLPLRGHEFDCGIPGHEEIMTKAAFFVGVDEHTDKVLSQQTDILIRERRFGHAVAKGTPLGRKEKQARHAAIGGQLATDFHIVDKGKPPMLFKKPRINAGEYILRLLRP
jgi:hypothetical protein